MKKAITFGELMLRLAPENYLPFCKLQISHSSLSA